jgi:hypothetical protein
VLFNGLQYLSLSHTDEDIDRTLDVYAEALRILRFAADNDAADALLQGRPIEPVFRPL